MMTKQGRSFHKTNCIVPGNSTFGQSRHKMEKLYVDAILTSKETLPGPSDTYPTISWVAPNDHSYTKTSPQFSMSKKTKHFEKSMLSTQQSSPGPGNYGSVEPRYSMIRDALKSSKQSLAGLEEGLRPNSNSVDRDNLNLNDSMHQVSVFSATNITNMEGLRTSATALKGSRNSTMQKVGKSLTSTIHNERGYSFGGARDRFHYPTMKVQSPPPNAYHISDSIGYD